jgi:hypothetical protein
VWRLRKQAQEAPTEPEPADEAGEMWGAALAQLGV